MGTGDSPLTPSVASIAPVSRGSAAVIIQSVAARQINNPGASASAMHRRQFVSTLATAGGIGLAGCLGGDEEGRTQEERVRITVINRLDRALEVDVVLLEPNQAVEEGIIWRVTFGRGDDSIDFVEEDLPASEYRIVLRANGYQDYEREWNLEECLELGLQVEARDGGWRETARSCRRPS
jgi:hypothetical protein